MFFGNRRHFRAVFIALAVMVSACGGTDAESGTPATTSAPAQATSSSSVPAPTTSTAPTISTPLQPTTTQATTTTTDTIPPEEPETPPALVVDGDTVTVTWDALPSTPFFAPASGGSDPFFHIHTNPAEDGFFLSLELYTTGYGELWTGETGTFDISCADIVNSTGICPYFDPDGPGPDPVLGDDFAALGSLTIVRLDNTGYEIIIHELIFSNGTSFNEFTLEG